MRTAVGQPYSDSTVEDDIRNLYKTGTIQNVRIFAQPEGDGVKVIVAVQTRPVIRELVIDGAHRVSAKKLRKEISVKLNAPVNEDRSAKSAAEDHRYLSKQGFHRRDGRFSDRTDRRKQRNGPGDLHGERRRRRARSKQIQFEGNEHFSERMLRKQMKTRGRTLLTFVDKSGRLDEVAAPDRTSIRSRSFIKTTATSTWRCRN